MLCHVVEQLNAERLQRDYPSLAVETLIANPRAYAANQRFLDDDLNRQFVDGAERSSSREAERAAEIDSILGPKGSEAAADVVVDLHTTTSNMGCTLIINDYCQLGLKIAAHLCAVWDVAHDEALPASTHPLRVYVHEVSHEAAPYLCSVGKAGVTVEVGPTPQGLLRADVVATTERALHLILRYLEAHYAGVAPPTPPRLRVYVDRGKVPWPAPAEGHASSLPGALIAASLQDRDFEPLHAGEPMFVKPDGQQVVYDGSCGPTVHPIFVNEAAYYLSQSGRAGVALTALVDWPIEQ